MEARTLKIAAAGCFAVGVLATSFATRFDIGGMAANVFTTLGVPVEAVSTSTTPVPLSDNWKSSLGMYTTITPSSASSSVSQASTTVTDAFAQALFEAYMVNRAQGNITSSDDRVALAQQYVHALSASLTEAPYTQRDIKVAGDLSVSAYIGSVANVLSAHNGKHEHELTIFKRLSATETAADREQMTGIATLYAGMEADLSKTVAPTVLASTHLNFLNAIRGIKSGIKDMAFIGTDPIRGAVGLERYTNAVQMLRTAIAEIQIQGRIEKVSFPQGTAADRLMNI